MHVRKRNPGGDSFGHIWEEPGAVVEMPEWQAVELLGVPGDEFTVVQPPEPEADGGDAGEDSGDTEAGDGDDGGDSAQEQKPARRSRGKAPAGQD